MHVQIPIDPVKGVFKDNKEISYQAIASSAIFASQENIGEITPGLK